MNMHRELNPQLFGNQTPLEEIGRVGTNSASQASRDEGKAPPYLPNEVKSLEQQLGTLKTAFLQMEKRTETLYSRMEDLARTMHGRLERFSQAISQLDKQQSTHHQDSTGKIAQIIAKVNERKVSDQKVKELIDRHNTIIRNFENRLTSLQRLLTEQEMALHNSNSALERFQTQFQIHIERRR